MVHSLNKNCTLFLKKEQKEQSENKKELSEIKNMAVDIKYSDMSWRIRLRLFLKMRGGKKDKKSDNRGEKYK